MSNETKDEIAAERDALRAEVETLRGQLAAAGARTGTAAPVQHQFVLTEGHRQELATTGVANVDGKLLTRDQVIARLGEDQRGRIDIPEVDPNQVRSVPVGRATTAVPGVDFVYPSVAPGVIDPAVAGTPGINGPAGTAEQAAEGTDRDAE